MSSDQPPGGQTRRVPSGDAFATLLTLHSVRLSCTEGPDKGRDWVIDVDSARLGSGNTVDIRLSDAAVSRVHAQVRRSPEGWLAEDLGSTNGVFVDGVRVKSGFLKMKSLIRLGTTTLRFHPREQDLLAPPSREPRFGGVLGRSPVMLELFGVLERVAPLRISVLLSGPTGSGKGALARAIHQASPRRDKPFIVIDCANLHGELIGSALFGHVRGAFTSADSARAGAFEAASGGTVFIDELGELSPELQPRLLRVLEDREVTRLGAQQPVPVDVRVVAATHRDLKRMVREQRFREDLFFRMCVVEAEVPPLARRPEDIPLLVSHFLEDLDASDRLPLEPEVVDALRSHGWPGNVRELRNTIERGLALAGPEPLRPEHLHLAPPVDRSIRVPDGSMAEAERDAVARALREHGGNRTRAARALNIAVTTLKRKMRAFGLE